VKISYKTVKFKVVFQPAKVTIQKWNSDNHRQKSWDFFHFLGKYSMNLSKLDYLMLPRPQYQCCDGKTIPNDTRKESMHHWSKYIWLWQHWYGGEGGRHFFFAFFSLVSRYFVGDCLNLSELITDVNCRNMPYKVSWIHFVFCNSSLIVQ